MICMKKYIFGKNMSIRFNDLSKFRSSLMGAAIIYVFLFHTVTDWAPDWIYKITCNGDNGVDIFIFLSALGLSYSMDKNPNILDFYKRRLFRIFPTYWASISIIYLIVVLLIKILHAPDNYMPYPHSLWEAFTAYTTLGYWLPCEAGLWYDWYVPALVAMYLFFPFLFIALKRNKCVALLFIVPTIISQIFHIHMEWWYSCMWHRLGIFILGAASYYLMNKSICGWKACVVLIVGSICPFIYAYTEFLNTGNGVIDKLLFSIALLCSMLVICQILAFKVMGGVNKILLFMGGISLEFYLVHQQLNRMMITVSSHVMELPHSVLLLFTFIASLIMAVMIQKSVAWCKKQLII